MTDPPLPSDTVQIVNLICNFIVAVLGLVVTPIWGWLKMREKKQVDGLVTVTKATHSLVNSGHGRLLKLYAISMRRHAKDSGLPSDEEIATLAESAFADHEAAQARVDAQPGTDAQKKGHA
jgi:hypothetical protein